MDTPTFIYSDPQWSIQTVGSVKKCLGFGIKLRLVRYCSALHRVRLYKGEWVLLSPDYFENMDDSHLKPESLFFNHKFFGDFYFFN